MMAFGLRKGITVAISAEGTDEKQAVDSLEQFLTC